MPRSPRQLPLDHCFHVTVRCNNREFRLIRFECRAVLVYALDLARDKFGFQLFGLCIMSKTKAGTEASMGIS